MRSRNKNKNPQLREAPKKTELSSRKGQGWKSFPLQWTYREKSLLVVVRMLILLRETSGFFTYYKIGATPPWKPN